MRRICLFSFGVCYLTCNIISASHAQSGATSRTKGQGQASTASTQTQATETTPYERLRAALRPRALETAADIRAASTGTLVDRVVEIKGTVMGVITRSGKRLYTVQADDTSLTLPVGPDFTNGSVLRPGASVRLLVQIDPNTESKHGILSIIAATDHAELDAPVTVVTVTNPDSMGPIIVAPPGDIINLMPPPPTRRPAASQPSPQAKPQPRTGPNVNYNNGYGATQNLVESQKPAYKALVRRYNKKLSEAQVEEIATALLNAGYANNLDPRFLAAIIAVESDFDIYCVSSSGAMGLGQLMPFNLKEAGITNAWNPTQNVWGTARLLRGHLNDYRNRADGTLLAVAAYNAGPGAVRRAGYKVPNGAQVQRYVWKVYYRYKEFAPDMFN